MTNIFYNNLFKESESESTENRKIILLGIFENSRPWFAVASPTVREEIEVIFYNYNVQRSYIESFQRTHNALISNYISIGYIFEIIGKIRIHDTFLYSEILSQF